MRKPRSTTRHVAAAAFAFAVLAPGAASAAGLPDFDVRSGARETTLEVPTFAAGGGAAEARVDTLTGTVSRLSARGKRLSAASRLSPLAAAHQFLASRQALYGLTGADGPTLRAQRLLANPRLNVTHLTLGQHLAGVPVFGAEMNVNVDGAGRVVSTAGTLVPQVGRSAPLRAPQITPAEALRCAGAVVGVEAAALGSQAAAPRGPAQRTPFTPGLAFARPPEVSLTYFPLARGRTALAWETRLWPRGEVQTYQVLIDAATGEPLYRRNLTWAAAPDGQVFDKDAPQDGTPFLGFVPPVLDRVLAPFNGGAFFAPADPHFDWWAGRPVTWTVGNNVAAVVDRAAVLLGAGGSVSPVNAESGSFAFPLSLDQQPTAYQEASASNLFFWSNRFHDFWYQFGFDEPSGNFQDDNFGRGGLGGDAVISASQVGADVASDELRNNAFFVPAPDGDTPLMAMFEFDVTATHRDGSLDTQVMAHEFFHGVSTRLCGDSGGLGGFQGGALGEGLSDFAALMVLAEPVDALGGRYPIAGYVVDDFARGIRSRPYSTDQAVFNRTFKNLRDKVRGFGPEIHLAGEIIANALWDLYTRLASKHGFEEGRRRACQLLIDALKLGPANPTFLDVRDSILTADELSSGGDAGEVWAAFARAGMGVDAVTTGVNDIRPRESFDLPAAFTEFTAAAPQVTGGKPVKVTLTFTGSAAQVRQVTLTSSHPGIITVPAAVNVGKKKRTATVTLKTARVNETVTNVLLTATFDGVIRSVTVRVAP